MAKELPTRPVIDAIYELERRHAAWPTIERIAEYLKLDQMQVRLALLELRRKRIVCDRTRMKERVWMPWRNR